MTFNPYLRYDTVDRGRSIFDLHELKVSGGGQRWHVKAGYDVEFWGVMEFVNPVNVLNQTDVTEDFLSKRKLGSPDGGLDATGKFGTIDCLRLDRLPADAVSATGRQAAAGRPIDQDEASLWLGKRPHAAGGCGPVFAEHATTCIVGVSHFYGYAREPEMRSRSTAQGAPFLARPTTWSIRRGVELQVTFGNVILKSEDVFRVDALRAVSRRPSASARSITSAH